MMLRWITARRERRYNMPQKISKEGKQILKEKIAAMRENRKLLLDQGRNIVADYDVISKKKDANELAVLELDKAIDALTGDVE